MGQAVDLSILIPARNEEFLARTIEDILKNKRGRTNIIVGLDGQWANPGIPNHEDVILVYYPESIGQRAITNQLCKLSSAKYVMKVDAHCAFDEGFDIKLMADMQDDWTVVPIMRNLHAFDWVCEDGHRRYQGPSGECKECGKPTTKEVVWYPKPSPQSTSYCFDSEPHFQYFGDYKKKQIGDIVETMSLQGSCFMLTREKYWGLDICSEQFGSWGSQGIEVAVKTWLSGGKVLCNKKTWYAHMFRTQGGDFSFPYPQSGKDVSKAKQHAKELFFNNKWEKQIYPLSWLVDRFWPVPGWSEKDLAHIRELGSIFSAPNAFTKPNSISQNVEVSKMAVYYTCNTHDQRILDMCREQLLKCDIPISSVSLKKDIGFGTEQVIIKRPRGPFTYHRQILFGLYMAQADVIFLTEADVMYDPSHFEFVPPRKDTFYYNTNVWKVDWHNGHCFYADNTRQVSGLCAYRELLLDYYIKKLDQMEKEGFNNHFEPGSKQTVGGQLKEDWHSPKPNLDIRHNSTWTRTRWKPEQFKNKDYTKGWQECEVKDLDNWSYLQDTFIVEK